MPRRNSDENLSSLVDAMEKRAKDLNDQVVSQHQQLSRQVSDGLLSLRGDHVETRDRVNVAVAQATQAAGDVAGLGNEIGALRAAIEDLRESVRQAPPPAPATGAGAHPGDEPASSLPEPAPSPGVAGDADRVTAPEPEEPTVPDPEPRGTDAVSDEGPAPGERSDPEDAEARARAAERKARASRGVPERDAAGEDGAGKGTHPCGRATQREPHARSCSGEADGESVVDSEEEEHHVHLLRAVRLSRVYLRCHRDTWDFVASRAAGHRHVSATAEVHEESHGRLRVTLSGRSLIGVLSILHETRVLGRQAWDGDWAMAEGLYRGVTQALPTALGSGASPLTVVFDDGVHAVDDDAEEVTDATEVAGDEGADPRWR